MYLQKICFGGINIWRDRWIPGLVSGGLGNVQGGLGCNVQYVHELIVDGRWDLQELRQWISEEEYKAITGIPLSLCGAADKLIWNGSKNGMYNVKNGYHLAKKSADGGRYCSASSSFVCSEKLWKIVWSECFPPKIQHFLWRAISGALATKDGLCRRRCGNNSVCPICWDEA